MRILVIDSGYSSRRIASRLALMALAAVAVSPMPALGPRGRLDLGPDPSAFDEPQGKRRAQWKAETRGRRK